MEIDSFVELASTTEESLINRACTALENAKIPVLIEHIADMSQYGGRSAFRLLVPLRHSQRARRVSASALTTMTAQTARQWLQAIGAES